MKTKITCPFCACSIVKEIIYGMPDFENFDFQSFEVGGCCVEESDPKYKCVKCEISW